VAQIHVSVGTIPAGDDAGQDAADDAGNGKAGVPAGILERFTRCGGVFVTVGLGGQARFPFGLGFALRAMTYHGGSGKPPVSSRSLRKIAASLLLGSRMAGDHLLDPCPHLPARSLEAEPMLALAVLAIGACCS
jgi:hypothetical protein